MVPTPEKLRGFCLVFHPRRQLGRLAASSQLSSYGGVGESRVCLSPSDLLFFSALSFLPFISFRQLLIQ